MKIRKYIDKLAGKLRRRCIASLSSGPIASYQPKIIQFSKKRRKNFLAASKIEEQDMPGKSTKKLL
ncbi:MAG: hypothetical protein ACFB0C_16200, partial [Leptolyngbyaceae cyanobacterium]